MSNLKSVTMPDSVTEIGEGCFSMTGIENLDFLSKSITRIPEMAFDACKFNTLIIPEHITHIGNDAFSYCAPTTVIVPNTVVSFGNYWLSTGDNLTYIEMPVRAAGTFSSLSAETIILTDDGTTRLGTCAINMWKNITTLTLPNCIKEIGDDAICGAEKLMELNLPSELEKIGYAGIWLENIETLTIPASVHTIANGAIQCPKLNELIIKTGSPFESKSKTELAEEWGVSASIITFENTALN